jgi:hypothetical protein
VRAQQGGSIFDRIVFQAGYTPEDAQAALPSVRAPATPNLCRGMHGAAATRVRQPNHAPQVMAQLHAATEGASAPGPHRLRTRVAQSMARDAAARDDVRQLLAAHRRSRRCCAMCNARLAAEDEQCGACGFRAQSARCGACEQPLAVAAGRAECALCGWVSPVSIYLYLYAHLLYL